MAGRTFVNRADGCVPTFLQSEGIGNDRQKTVAQFEVGRTEDVVVNIAGRRVEAVVRRGLARGRAVDVRGAAIGVGGLPVPAITRIRTLQLARDVVTVTAMSVGQQDDAIEFLVFVKPSENRTAIFSPEAGQMAKVEVALRDRFDVFPVEAFES